AHILKDNCEYFGGAKRICTAQIPADADHGVPPFQLVANWPDDDIAVFKHSGIELSKIPKESYALDSSPITLARMKKNVGTISFILGAPGEFSKGFQYPDGL